MTLGVDAIWITPCFPSPQVDFGYDVSDYENIDPMYGTLADFDHLVAEGKKHQVRIILDFVMNHTSDQHSWFLDSKSSRTSPYRDWYIWRDGRAPGQPPNNWNSIFGGSAWTLDPVTNQYYYHFFYAQQPDLNWRNPAVEKVMIDTTRWWYKRGVSGFRLDAVGTLFEDPGLHDNPVLRGTNKQGDPNEEYKYNTDFPEVHDELQKLRKVADESGAVLIGETCPKSVADLDRFYGSGGNELQMPMDFMFTAVNKLSPPEFRRQIAEVESAHGWPVFVIGNHDRVRSYNRYGDGKHNDAIAKLMGAFYLTLRGTPILYYGEEIGMENNDPTRKEDVKDPIGRTGWPEEKGRDGERTPMQWNTTPNAGFSKKDPWLPVPGSYKTHNVASGVEGSQLGSKPLQESTRAAPQERSLARRHVHRAQRRRYQRDVLPAQLQGNGRAGRTEYVGHSAKSDLRSFQTRIRAGHSEDAVCVAQGIGERERSYAGTLRTADRGSAEAMMN